MNNTVFLEYHFDKDLWCVDQMYDQKHSIMHSVVKVWFSPVHKVFYLNPELDFRFSSTHLPELWTGPSVLVQREFGSGSEGDEPRTGLLKSVNHNFFIVSILHANLSIAITHPTLPNHH
jgi:hypothetical protein